MYRVCNFEKLASVVANLCVPVGAFDALVSMSFIEVPSSCVKRTSSVRALALKNANAISKAFLAFHS